MPQKPCNLAASPLRQRSILHCVPYGFPVAPSAKLPGLRVISCLRWQRCYKLCSVRSIATTKCACRCCLCVCPDCRAKMEASGWKKCVCHIQETLRAMFATATTKKNVLHCNCILKVSSEVSIAFCLSQVSAARWRPFAVRVVVCGSPYHFSCG